MSGSDGAILNGVHPSHRSMSSAELSGLSLLADGAVVLGVPLLAYKVYVAGILKADMVGMYAAPVLVGATLMLSVSAVLGLYRVDQLVDVYRQIPKLLLAWIATVLALLLIGFGLQLLSFYSRAWAIVWIIGTPVSIFAVRAFICHLVRSLIASGRLARNAVVVGDPQETERLLGRLAPRHGLDYHIVGVFPITMASAPAHEGLPRRPFEEAAADLVRFIQTSRVDDVFVALPWAASDSINQLIAQLSLLPVNIRLVSDSLLLRQQRLSVIRFNDFTVLEVVRRPLQDWDALLKRGVDVIVAAGALILLAPILAVAAAAIKLESPGPVIFRQKRFGFNNREFEVLKLRTMRADCCDPSGAKRTLRGDSRVTRIGRLLRRTSIDEVPQLINVLKGDMSIIGPRAHPVAMRAGDQLYHEAVTGYVGRHRVRPGLTGWAQVNGLRGEIVGIDMARRRVEYDLFYIENWSIWLDFRILLRTLLILFRDAY